MKRVRRTLLKIWTVTNEIVEMNRTFAVLDMIGFCFGIVNSWSSLGTVLIVGLVAGGPPVIIWGWLGVCVFSMFVALAFAEMCSAYPIAGGQYSWVAILAPPKWARPLSYVTGWFMNAGLIGMTASCWLVAANFIQGIVKLNYPSYVIERWHNVLMCYSMALGSGLFNVFLAKHLHRVSKWNLFLNITAFLTTTIVMLVCQKEKQSLRFVFVEFQNETGFDSPGMAVMIGLLQCLLGMACYDAPSKMTEEMDNPTRDAPRAILASVGIGAVTGFVYLVTCFLCIGDLSKTANSPTGVPIIQIFYDSTKSTAVASLFASMLSIGWLVAGNSVLAESSRGLWAFARDNGLPASRVFDQVNDSAVPRNAIILTCMVQMALNSIYFGSPQGYSTLLASGVFSLFFSYLMTLLTRLFGYVSGHAKIIPGPYSLGSWSPLVHLIGLLYLIFAVIEICFPAVGPVTLQNMNYCVVVVGTFGVLSLLTWVWTGRQNFTGPKVGTIVLVDEASPIPVSGSQTNYDTIQG